MYLQHMIAELLIYAQMRHYVKGINSSYLRKSIWELDGLFCLLFAFAEIKTHCLHLFPSPIYLFTNAWLYILGNENEREREEITEEFAHEQQCFLPTTRREGWFTITMALLLACPTIKKPTKSLPLPRLVGILNNNDVTVLEKVK